MKDPQEHWGQKAENLKKSGKFEEAIKIFDKVKGIKDQEKDPNYWNKKAIHCCDIGEFEQAKNALEKDLEINKKSFDSYFLMGKIFYKLKKYEESLEYYNKAFEEYSRQHLRNSSKVDQMKNIRKFEEAVLYADKVYQEKELDDDFWYHKGMTLVKLKKYGDASSCFETILKTDQKNTKILYELAKSELFAGNKENSLDILAKICKMDSHVKEKLTVDRDFESLAEEKQFQTITGLLH